MRIVSASLVAFALAGLAGCQRSEPGGGADKAHQFNLSGPTTTTSIRRGESQSVTLKVNRGKEFKQAVTLKAEAPSGVEASLDQTAIKAGDKADNIGLKIAASDKAALGDNKVTVTAKPETGSTTTLEVPIKITEAGSGSSSNTSTFSLSGPLTSTTVKQGETRNIDVTLKHADKIDGTVTVKADALDSPKGIKAEVVNTTIKSSDSGNVGLKVTASKDAPLGEQTIRLTAVSSNNSATIPPLDVKIKVEAP